MPNVRLFIATSLDGFIARKNGAVDWLFTGADYGYAALYASVDALVMGRKTYQQVLSFGEWPYADKACYVVSRGRFEDDPHPVRFVSGEMDQVVGQIRQHVSGDIWLVGGGQLVAAFRRQRLIDEYILSVHPILLGGGVSLFPEPLPEESLRLVASTPYPNGLVQLHYVQQARA